MITNKIIKELIAYFEAIEDRNGQEDNLLGELEASKGDFPAVVLRRTDLIGMGVDIDRITDSQMESLACQVEERLSKRYNWHEVEDVVRNFEGLPQFNEH